jgi:hypothetical protein
MPQDVQATVIAPDLEIAVVSAWPAIEYLHDLDATVADEERARRLFAAMARGALYTNGHSRIRRFLFIHRLQIKTRITDGKPR